MGIRSENASLATRFVGFGVLQATVHSICDVNVPCVASERAGLAIARGMRVCAFDKGRPCGDIRQGRAQTLVHIRTPRHPAMP